MEEDGYEARIEGPRTSPSWMPSRQNASSRAASEMRSHSRFDKQHERTSHPFTGVYKPERNRYLETQLQQSGERERVLDAKAQEANNREQELGVELQELNDTTNNMKKPRNSRKRGVGRTPSPRNRGTGRKQSSRGRGRISRDTRQLLRKV